MPAAMPKSHRKSPLVHFAVMLFSYAVRALISSRAACSRAAACTAWSRRRWADAGQDFRSALLFDYVLTGPSARFPRPVPGGPGRGHWPVTGTSVAAFPENGFRGGVCHLCVGHFWWQNIKGIHESSGKALADHDRDHRHGRDPDRLVHVYNSASPDAAPTKPPDPASSDHKESLGWLNGTFFSHLTWILTVRRLRALRAGHERAKKRWRKSTGKSNTKAQEPGKTGLVIFIYSMLFTSLVSFFAVMMIPDRGAARLLANLIGGISMYLAGPIWARLLFHGFVVVVGVLILAGAQKPSIVAPTRADRVAEDGVLTAAFQKPHPRFGTSYRLINLVSACSC